MGTSGAPPPTQAYSLGATIHGLNSSGLALMVTRARGPCASISFRPVECWRLASGALTSVSAGTTTQMLASSLVPGTSYAVRIETQPAGEACAVAGGVGTIQSAHVTDVLVTCSDLSFAVGGTISGLTSSGLVLANGSNTLAVMPGASSFTMPTPVVYGDAYAVTVQTQPSGLACSVSNGTGTMGAAGVTSVSIVCVPNFTLLYSFAGGSSDGSDPYHCLIEATDGDFYGTTLAGGAHSGGTIFEITQSGAESVFFSFASMPFACLTQGSDGNFYGTTASGGSSGRGTVFEITPSGTETTLYSFPAGASQPYTGLIQGSDGNFYGTTGANGTSDDGTVFEITSSGVKTVLHAFPKGTSSDGQIPYAGLVEGSDGNFYGTTYFGGSSDLGTVFMVTPSGAETVLYSFTGGSDGASPYAGLIEGRDGNLYGTTYAGGTSGLGTAFKITPSGTETVLYSFAGGSTDGANPEAGLTEGPDGNFYGTTFLGGASNLGTVFKLTPGGTETVLHAFAGGASDGAKPTANLVQGSDDNLYGSTNAGGPSGNGTFFKVTLP